MPKTEVMSCRPSRPTLSSWLAFASLLMMTTLAIHVSSASAQQVPDTTWTPSGHTPHWSSGSGPRVVIDAAHHNFHTVDGRYRPFADLLRRDGYRVSGSNESFRAATFSGIDILVIANANSARNESDWSLPVTSAFEPDEVDAVRAWVRDGGSLLLIADHMPFPGAAAPMAAAFGISFRNGFAGAGHELSPITFRRGPVGVGCFGGQLATHPIATGLRPGEGVDSLVSFTGSAFRPPDGAEPLLILPSDTISLEPAQAWQFEEQTPRTDVGGWCQGAVLRYGRGRVAVFGEAAMFSAQLQTGSTPPTPMGMNVPRAPQNFRFLLNTMAWLAESDGKGSVNTPSTPGTTRQRAGR
ncbi:MAG TPA: DUF4350 domain-containing protein [Candidatus Eisenbacteria bacterium]